MRFTGRLGSQDSLLARIILGLGKAAQFAFIELELTDRPAYSLALSDHSRFQLDLEDRAAYSLTLGDE